MPNLERVAAVIAGVVSGAWGVCGIHYGTHYGNADAAPGGDRARERGGDR